MRRLRSATVACPCCGYRTLNERAAYDICRLCWWEDDGQDDRDAEQVRGGPNGHESLVSARLNFRDHLTMYPRDGDSRIGGADTPSEVEAKRALMNALDRIRTANSNEVPAMLTEIDRAEAQLETETERKIAQYEQHHRSGPA